ncbi:dsDNA nuclease domain-containing protein [Priestia megaterium]|uniref:dsDNA nuclease domain-containing protein n=1 Tax=Priestia megaterium TaxID=1404 RepID=UPI0037C9E51E
MQKVMELLGESDISQDSGYEEFIENLKDGKSEEVIEALINVEPDEIGGRIALTGFYYQFLVFLEYWVEMLQGKWDFVALELHEDIVVGKGNKLRFIQVKSSKETEQLASETLSKRTSVKEDGKLKAIINDSWVDKLIKKANYFKKSEGFETEFQLITSFIILKSRNLDVKKYRTKDFYEEIGDDDDLVKFMTHDLLQDKNKKKICYEEDCGEHITELLSRFCITKRADLDSMKYYESHIIQSLSEGLGEGANLTKEDLMMLIGRLMKMCNLYKEDKLVLYLSETESNELSQYLEDRATERAEKRVQLKGSLTIIEDVFTNLTQQLSNMDLYQEINEYIIFYKKYLEEWISEGGTIRELINRYLDGDQYSLKYKLENIHQQKERLFELFSVNLLLILAYDDVSKFSNHYKSLLVKEIQNIFIGFLSLNRGEKIDMGIEKAKKLLKNYEEIQLLLNPPKTILQGKFQNNRSQPLLIELQDQDIKIDHLPEELNLGEVNVVLHIIPGGMFETEFDNLFNFNDINDLKEHLTALWGGLL